LAEKVFFQKNIEVLIEPYHINWESVKILKINR
jgi:hypothetical protein